MRRLRIGYLMEVIKDIWQYLRYLVNSRAEILFFCSGPIDEIWIRTALKQCLSRGLKCALVIAGAKKKLYLEGDVPEFHMNGRMLRFLPFKVFVTASNGPMPACMAKGGRYVINMPHSLISLHMAFPEGTFDGFNVFFAAGEHHVAEINAIDRHRGINNRQVVPVGYGKMDLLWHDTTDGRRVTKDDGTKHIVIAPSLGKGNILESVGVEITARMLEQGYRVTVRPHPAFYEPHGQVILDNFTRQFGSNESFTLEDPSVSSASLFACDLLISDYSGIAMEYAFLRERPVLYVNVPRKVLNNNWDIVGLTPLEVLIRDKIGKVVPPQVEAIVEGVTFLLEQGYVMRDQIVELRGKYIFNIGRCGEIAADEIEQMLHKVRAHNKYRFGEPV